MAPTSVTAALGSETRFRLLVERMPDGVLVVWPGGVIAYANPAAESLLARDGAALLGSRFGRALAHGERIEIDTLTAAGGGPPLPLIAEMRVTDIEWEGGSARLVMLRDITDHRRAEGAPHLCAGASSTGGSRATPESAADGACRHSRAPGPSTDRPGGAEERGSRGVARNVLLAEDNPDGREMFTDLLKLWGHSVRSVGDGQAALAACHEEMPEVALVDIGMPGLDGYSLARRLRSLPGGASVRLVALTGYGQPEDRARALESGFDEHLVKPLDLGRLRHLLEE